MANLIRKTIAGKIPILVGIALTLILSTGFFIYRARLVFASVVTDSFTDTTKINTGASSNYVVSNGQLRMDFNTGLDGAITVNSTKNINTDIMASGRTVADGINYTVSALGSNTITTSTAPDGIVANDEVLLINLQGASTTYQNVGKYEFLRVLSVAGSVITLKTNIANIYGATDSNATLTGQDIMVQRVPNYSSVTVCGGNTGGGCTAAGTITTSAFNGTKGGVLAFRVAEALTVNSGGSINTTGKGYRQNPAYESFCGSAQSLCGGGGGRTSGTYGTGCTGGSATGGAGGGGGRDSVRDTDCSGGGGGYGLPGGGGGGGYCSSGGSGSTGGGVFGSASGSGGCSGGGGGGGGGTYGTADLSRLFFGSPNGGTPNQTNNGIAGGILYLFTNSLSVSGAITSTSFGGGYAGGTGGSILIDSHTSTIGTSLVTAPSGRIAMSGTVTGTSSPTFNANSYTLPSATIQSTNLITGQTATSFGTFVYNLSGKPTNSTATIQFSTDGTNWYNSTGTLGSSNTLTTGANNSINLAPLGWSGGSFYYKVAFGGPATPALDDVTLNYIQHLEPPTIGTPSNVTTTSIRWNFTDGAPDETGFKLYDENNVLKVTCAGVNLTYCDETSLTPGTSYTRKVVAYDGNGNGNYSSTATIATLSLIPQKPTVDQGTSTTLRVDVVPGQGAAGTDTYAIYITTGACDGSGNFYLQSTGGTLGALGAEDWKTDANWSATQVNGLNLDSNVYKVCVKGKSQGGVETAFSPYSDNNGSYISLNGFRVTDTNQAILNKYKDGNNPTARYVYGADNGTGLSEANTAEVEIAEGGSITVGEFDTFVFGTIRLTSGSLYIDQGGQLKPGGKLLVIDADLDNYPRKIDSIPNDIPLHYIDDGASPPTGARRRGDIPTMVLSKPDCNDGPGVGANTVWIPATSACYSDTDSDTYTTGLASGGTATCLNTTSCDTATKYSASTHGASVTTTGVATLRNSASAWNDCNDANNTLSQPVNGYIDTDGDNYGTGALTTCGTHAGSYVASGGDCGPANGNAYPGSTYCGTTSFLNTEGTPQQSYDYNCSNANGAPAGQTFCGNTFNRSCSSSGFCCGYNKKTCLGCSTTCYQYSAVSYACGTSTNCRQTATASWNANGDYCGSGTYVSAVAAGTQGCQ